MERDVFLDDYADFAIGSPTAVMSPLHTDEGTQHQQGLIVAAGTPDYLAPEILLGQEHSYPADWWALGTIMFEFLTGCPPFNDDSPQAIFDNILSLDIPWPPEGSLSREAVDLISKLLEPDPTKRLGYNGAQEVKKHPFFRTVDWNNILAQQPPFVPQVSEDDDTTYFQPRDHIFPVEDTNILDDGSLGQSLERQQMSSFGSDHSSPIGASLEFSFLQHNQNLAEKNRQLLEQSKIIDNDDTYDGDSGDETTESPTSPVAPVHIT